MYIVYDFVKHERAYRRIRQLVNDYINTNIKTKEKIKESNVVVTNSKYQQKLIGEKRLLKLLICLLY